MPERPNGVEPVLRVDRTDAVLELTLDRPNRLNAVNLDLYEQLTAALAEADRDRTVRSILLTGSGRAFSAGADLKAHRDGPPANDERTRYIDAAQDANRMLQTIGTPVIAAVNGPAVGAGLELALSSDFMIVAEDARLRLPEVALGTFIGGGVVYTLAERVGVLKARELIYFGDFFTGRDAEEWGVASLAVPSGQVVATAREWARRLAVRAPLSLAAAKRLIGPSGELSKIQALDRERQALETLFDSDDWAEGIAAYHEDRDPKYRGT